MSTIQELSNNHQSVIAINKLVVFLICALFSIGGMTANNDINTELLGSAGNTVPFDNARKDKLSDTLLDIYQTCENSLVVQSIPVDPVKGVRLLETDGSVIEAHIFQDHDNNSRLNIYSKLRNDDSKIYIGCKADIHGLITLLDVDVEKFERQVDKRKLKLQSHEDNLAGFTKDNNDVNYMDFKVSLKYPIFHDGEGDVERCVFQKLCMYFAFSGRFGQYISTRNSAPVIGKRFNPEMFTRTWLSKGDFLDFAYGHESNGQSISTATAFQNKRNDFIADGENPDFARDSISRGWDYLGLRWHNEEFFFGKDNKLTGDVELRYFLKDSFLQGTPEEFNDWEGGNGGDRKRYDGINIKLQAYHSFRNDWFKGSKLALKYTTGYNDVAENNTFRLEWSVNFLDVPVVAWVSKGYNSDLVDYYKDITSFGLAFELKSFMDYLP